jgi:RNA polymerase sigma-70 factor, ECF subfamily
MDPAQLVRMHAPAVYAQCSAMVRDHVLAEDLAQDTFARAFAGIDGYRGEASPRTWLLAIARNRCLDHLAHAARAPWGTDPDFEPDEHVMDQPAPYDLLANRDDAQRAMAVLAENERALVVLHYGHGVGYSELADSFGIAQGAVRMRVSRALAKMRDALAADSFEAVESAAAFDDHATDASRMLEMDEDTLDFEAEEQTARSVAVDAPVLFPALYEEPSDTLWARLESLLQ